MLALAAPALAAEPEKKSGPPELMSGDALGQMLLGLVLVLVLIFALAWLVRRLGGTGGFGSRGFKVVASLPLGARERLVLVQAGSRQLLLGVAPGRVNLLHEYEQPLLEPSSPVAEGAFSQRLREALKGRDA
ncbi:flagellar biosynthetic protein FliO [Motiliproteus sp. SC1-56]|uniref:flagellar biosynthetic protein FliO n=1 Tax=Motiliproteus sp. SC1-56 TaxID=2799565 RepID=UPI001A8F43F9|nr:flagellar biosynthetic protein FliO [Motiliproteus sp. SC1-56]